MTKKDRLKVFSLLTNIVWQAKKESYQDCEIVASDIIRILGTEGYVITKGKK